MHLSSLLFLFFAEKHFLSPVLKTLFTEYRLFWFRENGTVEQKNGNFCQNKILVLDAA